MSKSIRSNRRHAKVSRQMRGAPASDALPLRKTWPLSLCIGLVVGSIAFSGEALAGGPTGGVVVGGSGTITQAGNSTVINQASNKLALNWNTFNVAANESVLFNQPGKSAVALNRILDQSPSQIFGRISSNGQVFLINTHGIIFGATAQLNVGGLLASTLDLTPNDFLAGRYNLNAVGAGAGIVNHGLIQAASGGSVSLVGGSVSNDGLIFANYGKINLDGADHAVLDFDGNGLINIQITGELKERLENREGAVSNKGTLRAEDGTVVLQASAAKDLFTNLVNNSGVIDASGISTDGGVVKLVGNGGSTVNSGTINASGVHGGKIQLLSDHDVLVTSGVLDASGTYGGGEVLIGGDAHGTNLAVQNAAHTLVDDGASINASAIQAGDGGKVVVWSDHGTWYYGDIFARGGALAGNGGFVEVSGKDFLQFSGTADRLAPHGQAGMLLLDPTNLTISATGPSDVTCTPGNCSAATTNSTLTTAALQTALSGGDVNVDSTAGTGGAPLGTINWTDGSVDAGSHSLTLTGTSITFDGTLTNVVNLTFSGANPSGTGSATGTGTITGLGGMAFNLTGAKTGDAGGISFNDFIAADATLVTGASGFDDADKSNQGITFAGATSVTGTGAITNVDGSFADDTRKSIASGITYSTGFASVSGAGTALTGVTGNFDIGTKISSSSTLDYSGFALANLSGSGTLATITGSGQTYNLTGTGAGNSNGVSWTGIANLSDSGSGTFVFGDAAGVTGTISGGGTGMLDYSAYTTAVNVGLTSTNTGTATGTGGFSGINAIKGGSAAGTVTGMATADTFTLSGANAFSSSGISFSDFDTIVGNGGNDTIAGSGQTYALSAGTPDAGSSTGVTWSQIKNISDSTGTVAFGTNGSVSGNITASTLDYGSYGSAVAFNLLGTSGNATTGIGGTWTGVTSVTGNGASATINGSGQTYTLDSTVANKGTSGTVTWTSFENLSDSTAGTFVFADGASLSGAVSGGGAGTLDYSAYTSAVNIGLTSANAGTATGTGGFSGINAIEGGSAAGTVTGMATADTFTLSGPSAFSSSGIAFTAFDTIDGNGGNDTIAGNGQSYALAAGTPDAGSGNGVTWSQINNISDSTGTVGFGTSGSVSGNVTAKTLDYSSYLQDLTLNASTGTIANGGVGGTLSGYDTIHANAGQSNTVTGAGSTHVMGAAQNQGSSGGYHWTGFSNITDATGTVDFGTAGSISGNVTAKTLDYSSYLQGLMLNASTGAIANGGVGGTLSGYDTVHANAGQSNTVTGAGNTHVLGAAQNQGSSGGYHWTGFSNINDAAGTVDFGTAGSISGNVTAKTLDYGSYLQDLTLNASTGAITNDGVGGTLSGYDTVHANAGQSNTVTGAGNTYVLGAAQNQGSSGGYHWTGFSNINDAAGTVDFGTAGSVSGNVTAGALNYASYGASVIFDFSAGTTASGVGGSLSGVTLVTGSAGSDTISGSGQTYALNNTTANAGSANGVSWSGFENINDAAGTVDFGTAGSVSGNVIADTLDYASYATAVTFDLSAGVGATSGVAGTWHNVATVIGSTGSDTITGNGATYQLSGVNNGNNGSVQWSSFENVHDVGGGTLRAANQTWSLTGHNQGTVSNLAGGFSGIGNLTDTGTGTFLMHAGADGDISGNLDAGTGGSIDYTGYTTPVNVNLSGSGSTGVGGTTSGIAAVTASSNLGVSGSVGGPLTIVTTGAGNTTTLGAISVGNDLDITANGLVQQIGAVNVAGTSTIDAGAGAIALTGAGNHFAGAVSLKNTGANDVALDNGAHALILESSTVGSGALDLKGNGITQVGAIQQAASGGAVTLDAGAGDLVLMASANDFTGSVTASGKAVQINDATDLVVAGFTSAVNSNVSLVAGGNLTLAPTITTINTGTADLSLSAGTVLSTQGQLVGQNVSLSGASGLTLNDDIQAAGTLSLTSTTGAINQNGGAITAMGAGTINAGGAVLLTGANNDFQGTVTAGGSSVALTDTNALEVHLTGTGDTVLNAGTALTVSGTAHDLTTNAGATTFGATTASGNLSTTAGGAVGQTGALAVTGTSTIAAGANAITLTDGGNHFTGATSLSNSANNAVALDNGNNALILGNVSVGTGTLSVTGAGITQAAATAITQEAGAGAASFDAGTGNALTLANANNDFTGAVNLTGGATQITDTNALTLGTLSTGALTAISHGALNLGSGSAASLNATSNGNAISQAGGLNVAGTSTIHAGNGTITLIDAGNHFTGAVSLSNSGANDVAIRDADGLILGNVSVGTGTLGVQAAGITQAAGTSITQSAAAGAASFNSGAGAITLANTGNDFTGAVNLTGGATQITDTNALTLGTLNTGALNAISHGALNLGSGSAASLNANSNDNAITQSGPLVVSGISTIDAGSKAITLTNANNDFAGAVNLTGGTTQITDITALMLGALNTGALTAISHGALNLGSGSAASLNANSNDNAITQTGPLAVSGISTIDAGSKAITLTNANNDFAGAVSLTGGATQITDKNALVLGALNTGTLTAISHGALNLGGGSAASLNANSNDNAITQTGPLAVSGISTIDAGSKAITLTNANNDFAGAVNLTGGTTQVTDKNALMLGALNTGALTAISHGALNLGSGNAASLNANSNDNAITQTGPLAVSGISTIDAGSKAITLTNANNDFAGAVNLTGGTTQVTDKNALMLGALNTGALTAISHGALNLGSGNAASINANSNNNAITQTGPLAVSGISTIDAGSKAITLTNANNDFAGAVSLTGGTTQITDKNALVLGALNTGALTAISHGALNLGSGSAASINANSNNNAITQSGPLVVSGISTIDAGSKAITLTNANNDFAGAVNLTGGATRVTDKNALTLGTSNTGALTAISHGALNLGSGSAASLDVNSNDHAISQAGALKVTGPSAIDAGSGAVTLNDASNDFIGAMTVAGTGVSIVDVNDLTIAGLANGANAAVSLVAGGVLGLPAGAIDTGTADLSLVSRGGSLATSGSLSGANVSLEGRDGITLNNDVTTPGELHLVSGAAIGQGAGAISADTLSGSSVGNTALDLANHIDTLGTFSAANFSLTNAQALTVNGPLTTTGNAGDIRLATTAGALVVGVALVGDHVTLDSAGNLALSQAIDGTSVQLVSGGNISQNAGIITADTLAGSSVGSTALNRANRVGALGAFDAGTGFGFTNAQALKIGGVISGGTGATNIATTGGVLTVGAGVRGASVHLEGNDGLAIRSAVDSGAGTTTLNSAAGAITESADGRVTAGLLVGQSAGKTALDGANRIDTVGSFGASGFSLTNAQDLTIAGPVNGGANTALTTTAGDLSINGEVRGTTTTLTSAAAISEGTDGSIIAGTLNGRSAGATRLDGVNHIGSVGRFTAASFGLTNAQSLTINGPLDGGASTVLATTTGDLTINGAVSGTSTALDSAGAIREGAQGSITAATLSGRSTGATSLDGTNHIGTLGKFRAADFALTNGQTLAVSGPLDGGAKVALTTTAGDLAINGAVNGGITTLKAAGAISEGAGGSITAASLAGQSGGATSLDGNNHIESLGAFTAANFSFTNAQSLAVDGPLNGGASTRLTTTAGNLAINGAVSGTAVRLVSAGAITEGAAGVISAGTLSGQAVGPTTLGDSTHRINNMVDTLGNFSSTAGFSLTNNRTLTLASVDGSAFTVDAGTSTSYLSVTNGDLFQQGTAWFYNGTGTWDSTGRIGTGLAPIYVTGDSLQTISFVGLPPAYFYALDRGGNLLPLGGGFAINVPTASGAGSAQNGNHGNSYIDPAVITANYRSYGIVPSGVRLPPDQRNGCDPDDPDQLDCEDGDSLGMLLNYRR